MLGFTRCKYCNSCLVRKAHDGVGLVCGTCGMMMHNKIGGEDDEI